MRPLLVSPHADDVCFSLLGVVASLPAGADVVTVFSESQWAEPDWDGPRGRDGVTAARAREDVAFCSAAGLTRHALRFEDSSIRLGMAGDLRRSAGDEEALTARVAEALGELLRDGRFGVVFSPLGLGGHTDHAIAGAAARRASAAAGLPVIHYEDVPYASELSTRGIGRAARGIDRGLEPVICLGPVTPSEKCVVAMMYGSQRKDDILRAMAGHSARLGALARSADPGRVAERLWARGGVDAVRPIVGPEMELVGRTPRRFVMRPAQRQPVGPPQVRP